MPMIFFTIQASDKPAVDPLDDLLRKIAAQDPTALEALYRSTEKQVYAFALFCIKNTRQLYCRVF